MLCYVHTYARIEVGQAISVFKHIFEKFACPKWIGSALKFECVCLV